MLFEPGDIFEVRVKSNTQRGANQIWLTSNKISQFIDVHLDIHKSHKRHVWVGVGARDKVGSTNPIVNRVLWVDLDASITDDVKLEAALATSGLPQPTMVVWSGNGYHLYWKLDKGASPDEVRAYAKGVHASLPSDSTHDPTRVMRVPGTWNFKDEDNPSLCVIHSHDTTLVYSLQEFPRLEVQDLPTHDYKPSEPKPLHPDDFTLFVSNWLDGQKHAMAVGVAGYLRKNLYQTEAQALDNIARIHQAAGYSWPDENLTTVVSDTYNQPFGRVSGLAKLYELGVVPSIKDSFSVKFATPPKPKISIIDFSRDIGKQEFWMDGLIGPGMLTIWAAQPKSGKSFAVMQIGHALSQSLDLWGFKVNKSVRVLYFQGELSQEMVAERAISMFGRQSLADPRRFALTDKPKETVSLVHHPEYLNDLAENYDVIIVDPLSAFNSNDENSFTSVRETISVFDALKAKGKAVVIVHHTRKLATDREGNVVPPTSNDIRGSSAWFGAADAIAMQYNTPDGNSKVKFTFRAAPDRPILHLYRRLNGGFTDDRDIYLAETSSLKVPMSSLN